MKRDETREKEMMLYFVLHEGDDSAREALHAQHLGHEVDRVRLLVS